MIGLAMENAQVCLTCKNNIFFVPFNVFVFKLLKGFLYQDTMHVLHEALGLM